MNQGELGPLYCVSHPESRVCPNCFGCQQQEPILPAVPFSRLQFLVEDFT